MSKPTLAEVALAALPALIAKAPSPTNAAQRDAIIASALEYAEVFLKKYDKKDVVSHAGDIK